jgi:hypothetical protein
MTTNEIITELLKYDGWEIYETDQLIEYNYFKNGNRIRCCHVIKGNELKDYFMLSEYLTDLNILHRVAVKVLDEMIKKILCDPKKEPLILLAILQQSFKKPPINGEYITLATATAEAIVYLKKYKA